MSQLAKPSSFESFISHVEERDLLQELLRDCKSPNTKRGYERDLKKFFLTITGQEPNLHLVTEFLNLERNQAISIVLKYKHMLKEQGLAENTINRNLAAVRSLVKYAQGLERCKWSLEVVKSEKVTVYRDTSGLSVESLAKVLSAPDRNTLKGKRDYALIKLIWENALRCSEITHTNIEHFDPDEKTLSIWGKGKGNQLEAVTISDGAIACIQDWLAARQVKKQFTQQDPLFIACDRAHWGMRLSENGFYKIVRGAAEDAEVGKRFSPHRGRHTSITAYLDASNGDLRGAQKLSRHQDVRTLIIYDDNRKDLQGKATNLLAGLLDVGADPTT